MMQFRLGKPRDAKNLAQLHCESSTPASAGFMSRLGRTFLTRYYRVLLDDETSVVLCAVDGDGGEIIGFVSGTLDAAKSSGTLRAHRLSLMLSAFPALIRKPSLFVGLHSRQKSLASPDAPDQQYVSAHGARCSYWVVRRMEQSGIVAIALLRQWLSIMRSLGAGGIVLEVDEDNADVAKAHQILGARESRRYTTPDGKTRRELYYPTAA
jgi:hypothetical protein